MSTTQQFFASGAGNGFPFCLPHIDLEDTGTDHQGQIGWWNERYMDWVFYGGSTPGYGEQLAAAVKFWWTLETFEEVGELGTKTAAMTATQDVGGTPTTQELFAVQINMDSGVDGIEPPEPYERVCLMPTIILSFTDPFDALFVTMDFRFGLDKSTGKMILLYGIDPDFSWGFGSPNSSSGSGFTGLADELDVNLGLVTPLSIKYKDADWSNGAILLTPEFWEFNPP